MINILYMKGVMGYTLKEGRSKKEGKGRWKSHVNRKQRTGHLCKLRVNVAIIGNRGVEPTCGLVSSYQLVASACGSGFSFKNQLHGLVRQS